jgi:hypothetical protein
MKPTKDRTSITPELEARVKRLKKKARKYITKSKTIQFRLDEVSYEKLFAMARQERKPAGTLIREWVFSIINQANPPDRKPQVVFELPEPNHADQTRHLAELTPAYLSSTDSKRMDQALASKLQCLQDQIDELKALLKPHEQS